MYEHSWENHGVVRRFNGVINAKEYLRSDMELHADWRYDQMRYLIIDFKEAFVATIENFDLEEIASRNSAATHRASWFHVAVIANDEAVKDLVGRLSALRLGILKYRCFTSMNEARPWAMTPPNQLPSPSGVSNPLTGNQRATGI